MTKYKAVNDKIEEALKLPLSGKGYAFNVCINDGKISTTDILEGSGNFNKCPDMKLDSVPDSKEIPSPKEIVNKT